MNQSEPYKDKRHWLTFASFFTPYVVHTHEALLLTLTIEVLNPWPPKVSKRPGLIILLLKESRRVVVFTF